MEYTLPVASPNGVEDTQYFFGHDVVSFGLQYGSDWGPTRLKDGTIVNFKERSKRFEITAIDERNLLQCRCLNLC